MDELLGNNKHFENYQPQITFNTELNDLRKIICLRKSEISDEIISVCNVIEKLTEHGIHCLQCSGTNDVIYMLQQQLRVHRDFNVTSLGCHSAMVLSTPVCNSIIAMSPMCGVISLIIREEHGMQCMPCSSRIKTGMLWKKYYFLKYITFLKNFNSVLIPTGISLITVLTLHM